MNNAVLALFAFFAVVVVVIEASNFDGREASLPVNSFDFFFVCLRTSDNLTMRMKHFDEKYFSDIENNFLKRMRKINRKY